MEDTKVIIKERKRWLFFGLPFTFTTYTLTDKKLLINKGFFSSVEDEILLYRVVDITLKRGLMQKLFGLGTVVIHAQDKTTPILNAKNIRNSHEFKELLSNQVESEKSRLRMRKGEIIADGPYDHDGFGDFDGDFNDAYDSSDSEI